MRGTIWTVVALGVGAAFVPLVLDINVDDGTTGETAMTLLAAVGPLLGVAFILAAFGLLITFFGRDSF